MKTSLLPVGFLLLFGVSPAWGQQVGGVRVGVNIANLNFSGDGPDMNFDSRTGLVAGGFLAIPVSRTFAVQPEALFSQKGASLNVEGVAASIKLDFLDIPVLARASVPAGRGSALHLFAGPSFNFRLRARGEGTFQGETSEEDISESIERFEIGLVVGTGVEVGRLILDGRYAWGLTNLDKEDTDEVIVKSRVLSLTAGFRF